MRGALILACVAGLAVASAPRGAHAYPQFQLSRDQTCTACHLSPAGGGLLDENGLAVAETISRFGTAPEVLYGALPLPGWLTLGGELRGALGYVHAPDDRAAAFPMQADLSAHAAYRGFSITLTGGFRPAQWIPGNGAPALIDRVWSREHYATWQQDPGGDGLYVRAGRFMPVFGLRLAEHPVYTRRHGGVPLYADSYAAAIEYVTPAWEAHVTGFIEDPLIDTVVHDRGVAAYAEARLRPTLAAGGEAMVTASGGHTTVRVGATGKLYLPSLDLLVQAELQVVRREVTGPTVHQVVGHAIASRPLGGGLLLDVGLGHHDQNVAIAGLDRDALDVNLHWFVTSHLELVLHNRIEGIGVGADRGGPTSGWSLLHVHYRL